MSTKKYTHAVFIGRFSPFHNGHKEVLDTAFEIADNVIVLIGSSGRPRDIKNPFSFNERVEMITDGRDSDYNNNYSKLFIQPLFDTLYNNDSWISQVQTAVQTVVEFTETTNPKIAIIGHTKDESSDYLQWFPQWQLIDHSLNARVHAIDIRKLYFSDDDDLAYLIGVVPESSMRFLKAFRTTDDYQSLVREFNFVQKYKQSWEAAPYPPIFVTVDAVVTQAGHILMVKRGAFPGENLMALPGGFLEQYERIEDAVLRELKEETKIDVPLKVLRGNIRSNHVFDHPLRSVRGRTITHAFHIELPPGVLPKVKGSDDAKHAEWVPFGDIRPEICFEDHYDVIQFFIGT